MPSTEHDVGAVSDFGEREPVRVLVDGRAMVFVRAGDRVLAARDICPHQGARLSDGVVCGTALACAPGDEVRYGRSGEILVCPWHGWEYNLTTGHALADPGRVRIATYPARVADGRVLIRM